MMSVLKRVLDSGSHAEAGCQKGDWLLRPKRDEIVPRNASSSLSEIGAAGSSL